MKKVSFLIVVICTAIVYQFREASAFATKQPMPANCAEISKDLVNFIDPYRGHLVAFQLASNKSRGDLGHFSLAEGYLTEYDKVKGNYSAPYNWFPDGKAMWQPIPYYIMSGFNFEDMNSVTNGQTFPTGRKDRVTLHITENGRVSLMLNSWNNGILTLENMSCYIDSYGYYMIGTMAENNGTGLITLVFRKVDL